MKKTLIGFLAVLLAGAASGATSSPGVTTGTGGAATGTGANSVPTVSPPVTGAATPLNPNAPPLGAAVNPNPAQTQPPVSGAATPMSPNTPVTGARAGEPSNATLGSQPQTSPPPVAGQVPTAQIANAILNPLATTQAGAASAGQSANMAAAQNALPTFAQSAQTTAGQNAAPALAPGAEPPLNVQNLTVVRRNGTLILSGTVHTQADKDAAALRASAASGGETVVNDIVVQ